MKQLMSLLLLFGLMILMNGSLISKRRLPPPLKAQSFAQMTAQNSVLKCPCRKNLRPRMIENACKCDQ